MTKTKYHVRQGETLPFGFIVARSAELANKGLRYSGLGKRETVFRTLGETTQTTRSATASTAPTTTRSATASTAPTTTRSATASTARTTTRSTTASATSTSTGNATTTRSTTLKAGDFFRNEDGDLFEAFEPVWYADDLSVYTRLKLDSYYFLESVGLDPAPLAERSQTTFLKAGHGKQ